MLAGQLIVTSAKIETEFIGVNLIRGEGVEKI